MLNFLNKFANNINLANATQNSPPISLDIDNEDHTNKIKNPYEGIEDPYDPYNAKNKIEMNQHFEIIRITTEEMDRHRPFLIDLSEKLHSKNDEIDLDLEFDQLSITSLVHMCRSTQFSVKTNFFCLWGNTIASLHF